MWSRIDLRNSESEEQERMSAGREFQRSEARKLKANKPYRVRALGRASESMD